MNLLHIVFNRFSSQLLIFDTLNTMKQKIFIMIKLRGVKPLKVFYLLTLTFEMSFKRQKNKKRLFLIECKVLVWLLFVNSYAGLKIKQCQMFS